MGANIFGGAIAADEASANTFKNGMKSPGLVMMDAQLSPEQRETIMAAFAGFNPGGVAA